MTRTLLRTCTCMSIYIQCIYVHMRRCQFTCTHLHVYVHVHVGTCTLTCMSHVHVCYVFYHDTHLRRSTMLQWWSITQRAKEHMQIFLMMAMYTRNCWDTSLQLVQYPVHKCRDLHWCIYMCNVHVHVCVYTYAHLHMHIYTCTSWWYGTMLCVQCGIRRMVLAYQLSFVLPVLVS